MRVCVWLSRGRLVSDGICAADSLPSISSINRIIRDKSLYDVTTTPDDVTHDEVCCVTAPPRAVLMTNCFIGNDSAPIQLAQCRFPGLAIFNAKKYKYDTIRDFFNVRSKADMSQLNLPHGNDNSTVENRKTKK